MPSKLDFPVKRWGVTFFSFPKLDNPPDSVWWNHQLGLPAQRWNDRFLASQELANPPNSVWWDPPDGDTLEARILDICSERVHPMELVTALVIEGHDKAVVAFFVEYLRKAGKLVIDDFGVIQATQGGAHAE